MVGRTVEEYSKYRSPGEVARVLELWRRDVLVEFSGTFCETCGIYDWFEDFVYELERSNAGSTARIEAWRRISDRFLVGFAVRRL